ncbi:MAG: hypothetical protein LC632_02745 [Xanthomonadaceae bacterium]|nr:hypothetical protein [Xanthomonadaceae bacterium]
MTVRCVPLLAACALWAPGAGSQTLDAVELTCGRDLPPEVEYRVTYGPHWDGAWRISAVRPEGGVPHYEVQVLGVERADHRVDVLETHQRPALLHNMRAVRNAAVVMVSEMTVLAQRGEEPETHAQRRPLTVHIQGTDGGLCADGYADWPRIPGSYFFEAMDMLRESVILPDTVSEPWTAIRLHLRQVRSAWR